MELSSHDVEIPIPINSTSAGGHSHGHGHGHGHLIHHHDHHPAPHNHIIPSSASQIPSASGPYVPTSPDDDHHPPFKKTGARYKECLKNHAAAMGGNATDGCGEFMPSGEEGCLEALSCLVCNCHRNFHRKEIEGENSPDDCYHNNPQYVSSRPGTKGVLRHHNNILAPEALGYSPAAGTLVPSRAAAAPHHRQMILSYNMGSLPSEYEQEEGVGVLTARPAQLAKKRFRTKFTQEQKDKMLDFAEKVGWKLRKQEATVAQQFCQEIGVKRRVLKVWMHNNKHNLAKKNHPVVTIPTTATTTT